MLATDEYTSRDALGLASLVAKGEISAQELLTTAVAQVEALNPAVGAVVARAFDDARRAATDQARNAPFHGVPYLLKDLHAPAASLPLAHGSRLFADNVPDFDSETVARLRRAGLVIMGRTNSPEFGLNASTEPALHGPTRNPWNLEHSAGGSSGGAGAAVASGMLPAAHATDSGGSIRIPASCNGLVGLKPTRGRNPTGPHRGDASQGLSHEHAVTRSVRDCAALLDATAGPDVGAPYYAPPPERPFLEEVGRDPGRLRIAFAPRSFLGNPVHPECEAAVRKAAALCESLGHAVEEAIPSFDQVPLTDACLTVLFAGLAAIVRGRERQLDRPARPDELERATWAAVRRGREISGADYAEAVSIINREVRRIGQFFTGIDVLLAPTLARPPARLGALSTDVDSADSLRAQLLDYACFTVPFNATGQPAMSLPLHWSADGLPVGVQFVGRYAEDATLFRLAAQLEVAAPWFDRRPSLGR